MKSSECRHSSEFRYHPNVPREGSPDPLPRCCVFVPANCKQQGPFPVLYLLHGVGDNEYSWEVNGKISAILNELIQDEQIDPVLVVMPFGFIKQDLKLKREFPRKEAFTQYFDDVVKTIENEYQEIDREHQALAGLSMGGKQALEYGLDHLNRFEALGAFSAALHKRESGHALPEVQSQIRLRANEVSKLRLLYLSCGEQDQTGQEGLLGSNRELAKTVAEIGNIKLHVVVEWKRGKHDWGVWNNSVRQFLLLWLKLF